MLEKLKYPDSVKEPWNYDVTSPKEAEKYLNKMASEGYVLHWITRTGKALFVRNGMPRRIYSVAATGVLHDGKKEELKALYAQAGWTWGMEIAGLQIFQANRDDRPQMVEHEIELSEFLLEESLRDHFQIENESFNLIMGLIAMIAAITAGEGNTFLEKVMQNPVPLLVILAGIGSIALRKIAVKIVMKNRKNQQMDDLEGGRVSAWTMTNRILNPLEIGFATIMLVAVCIALDSFWIAIPMTVFFVGLRLCSDELPFVIGEKASDFLMGILVIGLIVALFLM